MVDWTNARNRRLPGSTAVGCLDEPGELAPQVEGAAVRCFRSDRSRRPWDRAAVRKLREEPFPINHQPSTINHSPRVLHAHNLAAWQYAALAKLSWRARGSAPAPRLVYTQHGANLHNLTLVDRLRGRALACFTDHLVAVSEATAEAMAKSLWIPRRRIEVVANGVGNENPKSEIRNPRAELRRTLGLSDGATVIGSVGRLAHVKGYDRLIRAFASLAPSSLNFPGASDRNANRRSAPLLLLVGDGPERSSLERLARDLGVAGRVIFAGYQADPAPYLAAMNLFVLPSRSEGLSVALLEAMAAGVPVLVTEVGANREVIADGEAGTLLPDDEERWPVALASALADNAREKVAAAQARVKTHYSLETTLDQYEKIYARNPFQPFPSS